MGPLNLPWLTWLTFVLSSSAQYLSVTEVAGGGSQLLSGLGASAPANNVSLSSCYKTLFVPSVGLLMTCSNGVLRVVNDQISWYAGSATLGFTNGVGTAARFKSPTHLATDGESLFVLDYGNSAVRKVHLSPLPAVQTFASGFTFDRSSFAQASGSGIAVFNGSVYVADAGSEIILRISASGVKEVFAGGPSCASGTIRDGVGTNACFYILTGLALGDSGVLYIADSTGGAGGGGVRVRSVPLTGVPYVRTVSTIAKMAVYRGFSFYKGVLYTDWYGGANSAAPIAINLIGSPLGTPIPVVPPLAFALFGLSVYNGTVYLFESSGVLALKKFSVTCPIGYFCVNWVATPCPPGSFCPTTDLAAPTLCPLGYYAGAPAMAQCLPCSLGSYADAQGASACRACPPGTFSVQLAATSASACGQCPAGSYNPLPASSTCQLCPTGTYSAAVGATAATACLPCPLGTSNPYMGGDSLDAACLPCAPGFFSAAPGLARCAPCGRGTASQVSGANSSAACSPCSAGTWSSAVGATACLSCPAGTTSLALAATAPSTCAPCAAGSFNPIAGLPDGACQACPPGTFSSAPGAPSCSLCPPGTFLDAAGAASAAACAPCRAGTFNPAPGQASAACSPCPAGTAGNASGARALAQCASCPPGSFSPAGSPTCAPCPAGTFAALPGTPGACTPCPSGYFSGAVGAASPAACTPCPNNQNTAVAGATSAAACLPATTQTCAPGTQPAAAGAPILSQAACTPLTCQHPLLLAAGATACAGCGPGSFGNASSSSSSSSCAPCPSGLLCPGLTSLPLIDLSSRALPLGAAAQCPLLSSPPQAAVGGGSSSGGGGGSLVDAPTAAAASAVGACLALLLLSVALGRWGCGWGARKGGGALLQRCAGTAPPRLAASLGAAPPSLSPEQGGWAAAAAAPWPPLRRLLSALDAFALAHATPAGASPVRQPTLTGASTTLFAFLALGAIAAVLVAKRSADNVLVQQSLALLKGDTLARARALPWAALPPAAPLPQAVLVLRVTAAGEPGACAAPLAPLASAGLSAGSWVLSPAPTAHCDSAAGSIAYGASQFTLYCAGCEFTATSLLSFFLHYSCQSLVLEAAAVNAAGELTALALPAAATSNGSIIATVDWQLAPLFATLNDTQGSTSARGYQLLSVAEKVGMAALPVDAAGRALVQPATGAIAVTLALPLQSFASVTTLSQLQSVLQLLGSIAGFQGVVFGAAGLLFALLARISPPTGAAAPPAAPPAAGAPPGEAPFADASNPLWAAGQRGATKWKRCSDASGDVWYCNEESGEVLWTVPSGGTVVEG